MATDSDILWKQIERLLRRRPGWVVLALSTPGMLPYWSFARGSGSELFVQVVNGSIDIQLTESERLIQLQDVSELETWLAEHQPDSLQDARKTFGEKLKTGKLFIWN